MIPFRRQSVRNPADQAEDRRRPWFRLRSRKEEGQGLLEAAVAFMFLLVILLVMYEMALVFASYIALLNTSVQGCIYAAGRFDAGRNLRIEECQPNECNDPIADLDCCNYLNYQAIMRDEALAGFLSYTDLVINLPTAQATVEPGSPITVTTDYSLTTFATEIVFPMFSGKLGVPARYHMSASHACPAR